MMNIGVQDTYPGRRSQLYQIPLVPRLVPPAYFQVNLTNGGEGEGGWICDDT